jgi:NADH-quinone oxidoreductase subunit G
MPDQKTVTFTMNDRKMTVPAGTLVIEAARRAGIEVPAFCYYPGLTLQAACRMCLVEVEKTPKLQTACTLIASEGMVVRTDTEQVRGARKSMLEFLLTNHPLDCPVCDKGGECELQDMVFRYGADSSRFVEEKIHSPEEKWSELVYYDAPRCILCFRCVRVCDEGMDVKALGVGQRGAYSVIIPNEGDHLDCEECGMCIDICPVGALTSGTYRYKTRPWEMQYHATVCAHCSNGCKTTLSVRNNQILRANNRDLSGINNDFLCVKGRFGFDFVHHADRVKTPLIWRKERFIEASWEDALAEVAARLAEIRAQHGPDSIAFIGSNRTTNEENYLLQRFARGVIGTNNIDHHRTADYAGLAEALGDSAAGSQITMEALGKARAFLLIGNDATEQNPLVAWRIRESIRHNNAKLFLLCGEEIKLCRKATQFVRVPAGCEAAVVRHLATGEGEFDADLTVELMSLKAALQQQSEIVILFGDSIHGAAIQGLVKLGASLPGTTRYVALGDYSNSRGAAEMGLLPDRLPVYARVSDAAAREAFGNHWGVTLPDVPGRSVREILRGVEEGEIRALYVTGANPLKTFGMREPDALRRLPLLVVQDLFRTETSEYADVFLPALCAYEKNGTVTNTCGEVQLLRKALDTMGPRSDFDILRILSHQLAKAGVGKAIHLRNPEAALDEIRKIVPGYDVETATLLSGGAVQSACVATPAAGKPYDVPAEAIFSTQDMLFTSGSLGKYCIMLNSVPEARREVEMAGVKSR